MEIQVACDRILEELKSVIQSLNPQDFTTPIPALSQSTIGQHTRHILEFFECLQTGISQGVIDYDARQRNLELENSPVLAVAIIESIQKFIQQLPISQMIELVTHYEGREVTSTTISRELIYNIEHAIHHMALIRAGLISGNMAIEVPESFGVARSTMEYRKSLQKG